MLRFEFVLIIQPKKGKSLRKIA